MPLLDVVKLTNVPAWLALWEIDDSTIAEVWMGLPLADQALLASIAHKERRIQSGAGRLALKALYKEAGISYRGYRHGLHTGPPFVSLSHSQNLAAAMLSMDYPVGLDIEHRTPRQQQLLPRIVNPSEREQFRSSEAAWIWVAKEAGYKWGYRRGLSLQNEVVLSRHHPAEPTLSAGRSLNLQVTKDGTPQLHAELFLDQWAGLDLAWVCAPRPKMV